MLLCSPGVRSKAAEEHLNASTPKATPVPTGNAGTLATLTLESTLWLGMESMAVSSRFRPVGVKLAVPRSRARRNTPFYRLKTPSQQVAMVLSALAEGMDASAAERVFGSRQATIITWLTRAGKHAELFHERCFRNLHLPHVQLDELRTRLRSHTQVLWLWLAIDPLTKTLPALHLGPRTQHMAHLVIHSLR